LGDRQPTSVRKAIGSGNQLHCRKPIDAEKADQPKVLDPIDA
jgi:hypothetical protein